MTGDGYGGTIRGMVAGAFGKGRLQFGSAIYGRIEVRAAGMWAPGSTVPVDNSSQANYGNGATACAFAIYAPQPGVTFNLNGGQLELNSLFSNDANYDSYGCNINVDQSDVYISTQVSSVAAPANINNLTIGQNRVLTFGGALKVLGTTTLVGGDATVTNLNAGASISFGRSPYLVGMITGSGRLVKAGFYGLIIDGNENNWSGGFLDQTHSGGWATYVRGVHAMGTGNIEIAADGAIRLQGREAVYNQQVLVHTGGQLYFDAKVVAANAAYLWLAAVA